MKKKFLTNLGLLLFLNLLIKPFWILGIDRAVQNLVGAEEYGFYFAIFNFSFLLNILLDFGITNFNNKNIAQNNHLLNKHFSSILGLKLMLATLYFVVTFVAAVIIGYNTYQLFLLALLGFNQFLLSFILYLRSNLSALHLFKTDSLMSVLDRILMIAFCAVLLWGNITSIPFQIEWFVYAQTAAYILTTLVVFLIVVKKARFRRLKWNYPFFIMIVKKSFPFAILVLLMTFYNRIDTVMMERILPEPQGANQAGIYAMAYRLLDAANMIAYLFAVLLLPIFARMIKLKESVEELAKLSFTLLIVLSVIVALGSCFYRYELMQLLYPIHSGETQIDYMLRIKQSASVFGLLMGGFVAISTTYVFGTLLTANGSLKQLNIMAASGMMINIILNFILIPRFLALGSAYASLITQFFTAIMQVLMVQWIFRFHLNYRYLGTLALFIAGVLIINMLSRQLDYGWIINFSAMITGSLILASALRLLSFKGFLQVMKEKE